MQLKQQLNSILETAFSVGNHRLWVTGLDQQKGWGRGKEELHVGLVCLFIPCLPCTVSIIQGSLSYNRLFPAAYCLGGIDNGMGFFLLVWWLSRKGKESTLTEHGHTLAGGCYHQSHIFFQLSMALMLAGVTQVLPDHLEHFAVPCPCPQKVTSAQGRGLVLHLTWVLSFSSRFSVPVWDQSLHTLTSLN